MNLNDLTGGGGCIGGNEYRRADHDWPEWEDYAEGGVTVISVGPRVGKVVNFWEDRQKRTCKTCGLRDDRLVRQEAR